MTIESNTFTTFDAVGNREDLSNLIYDVSPVQTPFMAAIGKVKATGRNHEWQTDVLDTPASDPAIEGDSFSGQAITPSVRLNNRTQINKKDIIVSETQNVVDSAGRNKEMTYQMLKAAKAIKRNQETALTGNQAPITGTTSVATQLRPLCGWYATNTSRGATGLDGDDSNAATDGTQRPLTKTLLDPVIQSIFTNSGEEIDMIMVGPFNKTVISGFANDSGNGYTANVDMASGTLSTAIDFYKSDFGLLKVVPNRLQRERDCHVLSTQFWAKAELRPLKTIPLAQSGDATKAYMVTEYTLEAKNEAASGIVADLDVS